MKKKPTIVAIFDNEGATFDRYTLIDSDGDTFGYSHDAIGFDQYCGNIVDSYMFHAYGYAWRKRCDVKKVVKTVLNEQINIFVGEGRIGYLMDKDKWPQTIINAYNNRLNSVEQ
jgi:hypothetical protein